MRRKPAVFLLILLVTAVSAVLLIRSGLQWAFADDHVLPWSPGTIRARDGHFVRSVPERRIDDFLYEHHLLHEYEPLIPRSELLLSDFLLPGPGIYIEYWGRMNDAAYRKKRAVKMGFYSREGIVPVELWPREKENLEEVLASRLRARGVSF